MKYKRLGDDRGLILPLALMAFVVLGALAAAILSTGGSEVQIASNLLRAIQAQFQAEAGLEHAFNTLRTTPSYMTNANATLQNIIPTTQFGGAGNYTVQYQKAGDYAWRVVSTGVSAIGGSQAIRRAIMSTFFRSNDAILTDGSMTIWGSTDVLAIGGTCGNIHANGNLDLNGSNVQINGNATATGTYTATANPTVGTGSGGANPDSTLLCPSCPRETVPHIDPADFLTAATNLLAGHLDHLYQLTVNATTGKGEVRDGSGTLLQTLNSGDTSTCGWKYTADTPLATWKLNSGTPCNGTYYFQGTTEVASSPGYTSTPWLTTLIATGDVKITGNPTIGADAAYTVHDSLFIAGRDVKIQGTPSNGYNGLIAAHEQFDLSGTGTIIGLIISENALDTPGSLVSANTVNGNITLTYNCGSTPPLQGPLQFLSWGL